MSERPEFWRVMLYACAGRPAFTSHFGAPIAKVEACGYETKFYLEVGCEGPRSADPWLTPEGKRVVPVPFCAGRCPQCQRGDLLHDRWNEDYDLNPRVKGPLELPHFAYPTPADLKRLGPDACGKPVYRRGPVGG